MHADVPLDFTAMDRPSAAVGRREFLRSCAGHLALAATLAPAARVRAWAQPVDARIVAREPFGYLQSVADGVWALISTPLQGSRTTLCNGGLVAGRSGVLAIEGFADPAGSAWLAARCRELTGRPPTHVVVTHFHSDHSNGVAGYNSGSEGPVLHTTGVTRDLAVAKNLPADPARTAALQRAELVPADAASSIDLGDRRVSITPHRGHTPSDLSLEIADRQVLFCGDLVWNGMFPNYVDAIPSELSKAARALRRDTPDTVYVPGHGAVASRAEVDRYLALLDEVEQAARRAHSRGQAAADGASTFNLPAALGTWALFGPTFFERAFTAWYRELGAPR